MKKIIACIVAIVAVVGVFFAVNHKNEDYLRIHIRANSNSEYDQNIKYDVKDSVVEAITPLVTGLSSKDEVMQVLEANLDYLECVVNDRLSELGQSYGCNIRLCEEDFPTRSYEELTLGAGVYDALIIELGSGEGDNWWCVAFPPLCFVSAEETEGDKVQYKSVIKEWIDSLD